VLKTNLILGEEGDVPSTLKASDPRISGRTEMNPEKTLRGKYILIVDDERDVVESLVALLDVCRLDTAFSLEEGKKHLEANDYDMAILDIMGVGGFELLKVAKERKIPALMLTAHGLSEENLQRSIREGAVYFAPKDRMSDIPVFAAEVLESLQEKKNPWVRFLERLGGFYDRRFAGTNWREKELEYVIRKGGGYL
jgi:CheY-like chemotaxis protein